MKLGLHQSARMEQRLLQSPQMIQAMQILQLPSLDLADRIEQELNENPLLEKAEQGYGDEGDAGEAGDGAERERTIADARLDELERVDRESWNRGPVGSSEDSDRKQEALQNAPDSALTLAEAISAELAFSDLDAATRAVAEYVVNSLDSRGYLPASPEEVARDCGVAGANVETVQAALAELRHLIHPAIAARDLRECLLLQLESHHFDDPLLRAIVEQHLDDVTTNRLPRIAKATGRTLDDVVQALEILRSFQPNPGASYGGESAVAILPDVIVEALEDREDGVRFEVRLVRERVPTLVLSPQYKEYLKLAKKGEGERDWVRKRLESARWFIDAVQQRQSTLLRISQRIFEHQREFLEKGVRGLRPLRMQQVADEIGVHISTVSRAVSGKFAQTPHGTLALKYFFTGGTETEDGTSVSWEAVRTMLQEEVDAEDKAHPLSDEAL
ncbi:MAG: RNA polymerase factor sigma-54, partial [Planctomycetota bacterium]